ncbi:MAG: hypothetical protein ABI318_02840 [Chthoniobacteraceae bacterium]
MSNPLQGNRPAFLLNALLSATAALFLANTGRCADSAEELIQKGDECAAHFQSSEGLKCFLPAEKLDPKNARLLVRIAQQYRHLMSDAARRDDKLQFGSMAVSYAQRAVALAPNDPETHLALAISYGKLTPLLGNKEQFTNSPIIKAAAEKSLRLDPANDLAWQVLGRWYLAVADVGGFRRAMAKIAYGSLPTATYDDAVRCFQKAIRLNPNRLMHYIELGRTLVQMGRETEARKYIIKGLSLPNTEKDDPETKESGRQLLAKLRG